MPELQITLNSEVEARWAALALFDQANDLERIAKSYLIEKDWSDDAIERHTRNSALGVKVAQLRATALKLAQQAGLTIVPEDDPDEPAEWTKPVHRQGVYEEV